VSADEKASANTGVWCKMSIIKNKKSLKVKISHKIFVISSI